MLSGITKQTTSCSHLSKCLSVIEELGVLGYVCLCLGFVWLVGFVLVWCLVLFCCCLGFLLSFCFVLFVMSCLYSAASLTRVPKLRLIRIIYYYYYYHYA